MKLVDILHYEGRLILDVVSTWPDELIDAIKREQGILSDFNSEQRRLDAAVSKARAEKDYSDMYNPVPNKFEHAKGEALVRIGAVLKGRTVLGFHCARLTLDEIEDIQARGLQPLSDALVQSKINRRVLAGELTAEAAQIFLTESQHKCEGRSARVCLNASLSTLRDESAVYRLFKSWGGEAVYGSQEYEPSAGPLLRGIGQPCIVIGEVDAGALDNYAPSGCLFVNAFEQYLKGVEIDVGCDVMLKRTVEVLDVIRYTDDRFETLTGASQWRESIS